MADIVISNGDRLPVVQRTVEIDGTAVNLTGGTAIFEVYSPANMSVLLSESATITTPASGIVQYAWSSTAATTLTTGSYFARFIVTLSGKLLSAPNDGYLTILVSGGGTGTFSYSGNPGLRPLDTVRFLIHDTDPADMKLSDAEIAFILSEVNGAVYQAAHDACYVIAGHYARVADSISKSVGDYSLSTSYSNKAQQYFDLGDRFLELASRRDPVAPRANAQALVSLSKRGVLNPNGEFYIGIHDNPGQ